MTTLIELVGLASALVVSILISFVIEWLCFEAFFRAIVPARRVAVSSEPRNSTSFLEMK